MNESYHVDDDGDIVAGDGAVLYDFSYLEPMSDAAKSRLAELHTEYPEMDWETAEGILIREGLLEEV